MTRTFGGRLVAGHENDRSEDIDEDGKCSSKEELEGQQVTFANAF